MSRAKFILLIILCGFYFPVFSQQEQNKGFYIKFHAFDGYILEESEIEYFDWGNKEIKLKKDTCISCLFELDLEKISLDIEDEIPHFTVFIDSLKILEGYFPGLTFKLPLTPLIYIGDEPNLEVVNKGIIKFYPYKSVNEINLAYNSLINYYQHHKKVSDRIDWEKNYRNIKKDELQRMEMLYDKRLNDYLKSKGLLKE